MLSKDEYEQLDWLDTTRAFYKAEIERRKEFTKEYSAYLHMTHAQIVACNTRAKQAAPTAEKEKIVRTEKAIVQAYLEQAITTLEEELCLTIIREHKSISEKTLMQMVWRDVDKLALDVVIGKILKSGEVTRVYRGPDNQKGTWYHLTSVFAGLPSAVASSKTGRQLTNAEVQELLLQKCK